MSGFCFFCRTPAKMSGSVCNLLSCRYSSAQFCGLKEICELLTLLAEKLMCPNSGKREAIREVLYKKKKNHSLILSADVISRTAHIRGLMLESGPSPKYTQGSGPLRPARPGQLCVLHLVPDALSSAHGVPG